MICRIPISNIKTVWRNCIIDIESISDCLKNEPDIHINLWRKDIISPNHVYSVFINSEYLYIETNIDIYDYLYENEYFSIIIIGRYNIIDDIMYYNEISSINVCIEGSAI